MKKVIAILIIALSFTLYSCSDGGKRVDEIVSIINTAAVETPAYGGEFDPDHLFTRPDGNVFANAKIKVIIDEAEDYKLSDEDKDKLTEAIDKFLPMPDERNYEGLSDIYLRNIQIAERNKNLTTIQAAKTLGDLLK